MVPSIEVTTDDYTHRYEQIQEQLLTQANLSYSNRPVQPNIAYNSQHNRGHSPGSDSLQYDYTSPLHGSRENIASPMETNMIYNTQPIRERLVYDYTSAVEANRAHNTNSLEANGAYTVPACPRYDEVIDGRRPEPPPHYNDVIDEELYAEVGAKRYMRQGRALCRFWQGRMEVIIRVIILLVRELINNNRVYNPFTARGASICSAYHSCGSF